jgi:cytidylate kinase
MANQNNNTNYKNLVGPIAIDGPVASGKSTVGKIIAERLEWPFADTGLMYRAIGYIMEKESISINNNVKLYDHSLNAKITINDDLVTLNGEDITEVITSPTISKNASLIAESSQIRQLLANQQRNMVTQARGKIVMVGRDITTVIVPDTLHKFYLDAPSEIRSLRRLSQQNRAPSAKDIKNMQSQIDERDARDLSRAASPLRISKDTQVIETAHLTLVQVVEEIMVKLIKRK